MVGGGVWKLVNRSGKYKNKFKIKIGIYFMGGQIFNGSDVKMWRYVSNFMFMVVLFVINKKQK